MTPAGPICVQIGALGGQGGGVLAEWLTEAARLAGYAAQATSIPGVAQRTGATTYYFEIHPERHPSSAPVFSLFPDQDALDLMAALEPTEAGRALEAGLITKRTTVVTARKRIYSTAEKSVAGDGTIPSERVLETLGAAAGRLIALDMEPIAARSGGQANAVLLGAIAASGVLPLTADELDAAIAGRGIAVESNRAGFSAGIEAATAPAAAGAGPGLRYAPPPDGFEADVGALSASLWPLVGHALARLVDYQDEAYARLYLERLRAVIAIDFRSDAALTHEVAKRLAAWMSFEDVIRVAQLKTRPGRLKRIRAEVGVGAEDPFTLTDFLKPGPQEIAAVLPPFLGRLVARLPAPKFGTGPALRLPTARFWGYGLLKLLARLRPWRRYTYGWAEEQAAIERWLGAVGAAARVDGDLALAAARLAVWARGYGAVRRRGLARLDALFADWNRRLESDPAALAAEVEALLDAARNDPDGDLTPPVGTRGETDDEKRRVHVSARDRDHGAGQAGGPAARKAAADRQARAR